jgi:hypothetical protein
LRRAERDLAQIWLASRMRTAVEAAAQAIDEQLQRDALTAGESRGCDEVRVVIVPPLVADVQVEPGQQRCAVVRIRRIH